MLKANDLFKEVVHYLAPPPTLTLSEWATQNRFFSAEESGSRPGPYDPTFAPYQNGVKDAMTDPEIERVVVMWGTRLGKTMMITNLIGYHADLDPCPILYMRPRDTDCKLFSKEELTWLFQNTPSLHGKLSSNEGKDSNNTLEWKRFPGGSIRLIGSNSPAALSGFAARLILLDEVDKYTPIESVGNPIDLAEGRATTYTHNKKMVYISNPSIAHVAGSKRKTIHSIFLQSTQSYFHIPCPHCGTYQPLEWENLHFGHCKETLDSVYYECTECAGRITEAQKRIALQSGKWVDTFPDKKIKGFNLSQLYSPFSSFEQIAEEWLRVMESKDVYSIMRFKNEVLGLPFEENLNLYKDSSDLLFNRRERYTSQVPLGVGLLTMAVDTQDSWLSYTIMGWGVGREAWLIKRGRIEGDPATPGPWEALTPVIYADYQHESGVAMRITKCLIDTQGHRTLHVNRYLRGKSPMVMGIFGERGAGTKPIITKPTLDTKTGLHKWEIGSNSAKNEIFSVLTILTPGPLYIHFPWEMEEEYFKEVYSEVSVFGRFKQVKRRNEALDELAYNLAAYNISTKNYSIEQYTAMVAKAQQEMAAPDPEPERYTEEAPVVGSEGISETPKPVPAPIVVVPPPRPAPRPARPAPRANSFVNGYKRY